MIYLDVTSCCRSSLNTGVQRVVRNLHHHLAAQGPVTPLRWDEGARGFCLLTTVEHGFLTNPFAHQIPASDNPERRSWWQKVRQAWSQRFSPAMVFPLLETLQTGDVVLAPEIFKDGRIAFFQGWPKQRAWKAVGIFYDAIARRFPDLNKPQRVRRFDDYLRALARFDQVLCISQESEDDLKKFWQEQGVRAVPTTVEWLGADFSAQGPQNPSNFSARRILCVGTLEKRKNHLALLRACERLWAEGLKFTLCLIGRAEASWGPTVVREIEAQQAQGWAVEWLRHVDDAILEQEYARASFTVFPSLIEGFGLPIVESVWHRRPCVCGHNGALGEVARGGGCWTLDQSDVTALAGALRTLLEDESTYQKLYRETGGRTFRSWETYAGQVRQALLC
jgi:glycosyltransferase involved in cell wall biosynthesis